MKDMYSLIPEGITQEDYDRCVVFFKALTPERRQIWKGDYQRSIRQGNNLPESRPKRMIGVKSRYDHIDDSMPWMVPIWKRGLLILTRVIDEIDNPDSLNKTLMKGTDQFKNIIQNHLNSRAESDPLFAETLKKEHKNIDDCVTYILNTVKKSGSNGFADDEIFGMAAHYYDEDIIKVENRGNGHVVVNHKVEMTEEEKQQAQQRRSGNLRKEKPERHKNKKSIRKAAPNVQASIFE